MTDLNRICICIRAGDNRDVSKLFKYYKVVSIINSAVRKVKQHNPEYDSRLLKNTAETEIWDEINKNYVAAIDTATGNRLVLRFIKAIAYNKLMNFVREDKCLKWTCSGYIHKFKTTSIDVPIHTKQNNIQQLNEILIDMDTKSDTAVLQQSSKNILQKALTTAIDKRLNIPIDNFIILLKYKEDMTYSEITWVLLQQFKIICSIGWVSQRASHGLKMLAQILKQYRPEKGENVL